MPPSSLKYPKYPSLNSNRARAFTSSRRQPLDHQPHWRRPMRWIISASLSRVIRGDQIPIARAEQLNSISRGFLPWRFSDAGPRVYGAVITGPASENLHNRRHRVQHYDHKTSFGSTGLKIIRSLSHQLQEVSDDRRRVAATRDEVENRRWLLATVERAVHHA